MNISISPAFLLQIRDRLAADDTFFAWRRARACRRALTIGVQNLLDTRASAEAPPDLIAATRHYWAADDGIRVDERAVQRIDRDGIWLSGWLRARTGVAAYDRIDPAQLALAIAKLPPRLREIFFLHWHEDLDYARIAARLGVSIEDVKIEITNALFALDSALQDIVRFPDDADGKGIA